jgi:hypothetical protein
MTLVGVVNAPNSRQMHVIGGTSSLNFDKTKDAVAGAVGKKVASV